MNYMRIKEGFNTIRIISNPRMEMLHFVGNRFIPCSDDYSCSLCAHGEKKIARTYFKVIDKADGEEKTIAVGAQLFSKIKNAFLDAGTTDCTLSIWKTVCRDQFPPVKYSVMPILDGEISGAHPYKREEKLPVSHNPHTCNLCGSPGVDMAVTFYCTNSECRNYKP